MASVTAKVLCISKTIYATSGPASFTFQANYADARNKEWADATPQLELKITVADGTLFEAGKHYTLTFDSED